MRSPSCRWPCVGKLSVSASSSSEPTDSNPWVSAASPVSMPLWITVTFAASTLYSSTRIFFVIALTVITRSAAFNPRRSISTIAALACSPARSRSVE